LLVVGAAIAGAAAVVAGVLVTDDDADRVAARLDRAPGAAAAAQLSGDWPTTTSTTSTTTTTAPTTTAPPTTAPPTTAPATAPPATAPPATAPPTTTVPNPAAAPPQSGPDGLSLASPLPRPWATSFLVADAIVARVPLFTSPGVPVPDGRTLENPTFEGLDQVFLIRGSEGAWLLAQIMSRPNSAMAWIQASDVQLRQVPNHIVIERGARQMTVYSGEEALMSVPVATGKESSPTPIGTFFVDGIRRLSPPHRAYGDGQVSFSGYSEVYESFGGGVGQVAMHGTQNPALIGTPASNGCVRMTNQDIAAVMVLAPTGTPVEVVP